MRKANLKAFLNKTERILLDAQFRRTIETDNARNYEWIKETKYGIFLIYPDNDYTSTVYSIFGRFEDTKKAMDVLMMFSGNTYSGKCNIHTFDPDEAIRQLNHILKTIL